MTTNTKRIESILVAGAGWIGRQIAAQCAAYDVRVFLLDKQAIVASQAFEWCVDHAEKRTQEQIWPEQAPDRCRQNIVPVEALDQIERVDLALECVSEQPSVKRQILQELSKKFVAPTIIASNSSYFTPSMLSRHVASPERYAHFHFHSPIWLSTVVDIVPGPNANDSIVLSLIDLA
jgi:3-hydroxybutyryl-CoA dehydrogenase